MVDVFEAYATDENLECSGAKMELGKDCGLLVARMNNDAYLKGMVADYERHKVALDREDSEAEALDKEITLKWLAKAILVGFYGEIRYDGKILKYSTENAKKLLGLKDLRVEVTLFAAERANYQIKAEAAIVKK